MKRIIYLIVVILLLFVILNLIGSIINLWHKGDLLTRAQEQLTREQQENKKLKKQLAYVSTKSFVEQEARDKLFFLKPGEATVIVISPTATASAAKKEAAKPNWQQWWDILFGVS